jgi:hypothetical protein
MDALGPFAKVTGCTVEGTDRRVTAYASGLADSYFSIPACTRVRGKYVGGYLTVSSDGAVTFVPFKRFADRLKAGTDGPLGIDGGAA